MSTKHAKSGSNGSIYLRTGYERHDKDRAKNSSEWKCTSHGRELFCESGQSRRSFDCDEGQKRLLLKIIKKMVLICFRYDINYHILLEEHDQKFIKLFCDKKDLVFVDRYYSIQRDRTSGNAEYYVSS